MQKISDRLRDVANQLAPFKGRPVIIAGDVITDMREAAAELERREWHDIQKEQPPESAEYAVLCRHTDGSLEPERMYLGKGDFYRTYRKMPVVYWAALADKPEEE